MACIEKKNISETNSKGEKKCGSLRLKGRDASRTYKSCMCQVEHGFVERLARSPRELDDAGIVVNRPRQNREATRGITRPHGGGDFRGVLR